MPPNPNEKPSTSKGIPPQYDELDKDESDDALLNIADTSILINENEQRQNIPSFTRQLSEAPKSTYESLDYEVCESELWKLEQEKTKERKFLLWMDFTRWIVCMFIGIFTGLIACFIDITLELLSAVKFGWLKDSVDANVRDGDMMIPYLKWILTNIGPVALGATLVTYVEPIAAGSGIPQVKCYLNGVKVPRIVRIKTLFVKAVGVVTSVLGGLAGGKEGPMIHSGAVVAAGISQGKSTTFNKDFNMLKHFRDDHEKRDFVVAGAAAGVSAAFGAPIGGVLFSLEEAASFWDQSLIWRTMFASVISSFTLNIVLSWYHGMNSYDYPGLFNLGKFEPLPFEYFELIIFMVMGIFGGLSGALWNAMNVTLSIFRRRYIKPRWAKVLEAIVIAIVSATVACIMIFSTNDCRQIGQDPTEFPVQLYCADTQYNAAAALWFQTPEASVKSLFHDPPFSHNILTLFLFVLIYYPLSCITFGMNVSLGIFIPTLLVGAGWGRLAAMVVLHFFPAFTFLHPGKYALIGAAAQLGGVLRMTISLMVILIETTGNITFALPLIVTLISAKWVGDYFNEGIYDSHIVLSKVPILPWSVAYTFNLMSASQIMSQPVVCIKMKQNVKEVYQLLKRCSHNGFPVVDEIKDGNTSNGRLRGLILRSQLIIILKNSWFEEKRELWQNEISLESFRKHYPRYPTINSFKFDNDKSSFTLNVEQFMNPSPRCVLETDSVPKVFRNFRALGLRHMLVVDVENRVKGMVTRKDFIRH